MADAGNVRPNGRNGINNDESGRRPTKQVAMVGEMADKWREKEVARIGTQKRGVVS